MIYFIRAYNTHIKIGYSDDPESRKKCLQTGSPVKLHLQATMPGEFSTEAGLHQLFSHLRVNGEWFRYEDELKYFIRVVKDNPSEHNIKTLYTESRRRFLMNKARKLGKEHKLYKRIFG